MFFIIFAAESKNIGKMRHLFVIIITLLMLQPIYAKADNSQLYKQLDAAIEKRAHYVEVKEKSLNDIKQGAKYVTSNEDKLKLYEQLANGYKAYEYDSAMTYVKKGLVLAQKSNNILYLKRFQLSQTSLLITRGFYAEAKNIMQKIEPKKEDPLDFVLWKPKKEGEPFWKSPWCDGRPGWHIECSVMSKKYLGEEIDIHAGGEDLVFPHHENEIAQSECCNGVPFAKYWMHNAFLNIDNRKMSKSLGNFRTVREIGEQYDLQVLRFFMLNAHYRSPLNFSADLMESSKNALERITEAAARLRDRQAAATVQEATEDEKKLMQEEAAFVTKFEESMDDDFNTADALAAVFELVKFANTNVQEGSSKEFTGHTLEVMTKLCDVLGLTLEKKEEILDEEIENLIAERQAARKAKDFARADEIRGLLLDKGIELKDTREGVKWKRI